MLSAMNARSVGHAVTSALACAVVLAACTGSAAPKSDAGTTPAAEAGSGGARGPDAGRAGASGAGRAAEGGSAAAGEAGGSTALGGKDGAAACTAMCPAGQHCELVAVQCIRAPCPAQASCVADPAPSGEISCDPRKILCKRAAPSCGQFEVPSVEGSCYGPCVSIEACPCTGPEQCPDSNQYTCHMSAKHCTPYL